MILFGKEASHISVTPSVTAILSMSFDVLLPSLSHLYAAFGSKIADGLPAHS
ncbi:hypothetical protein DSO57_1029786 [Entomophthora muscae]|uniref:Uncharacterized protein n=1 Tax=Entomophthora muscae TaxID=34485 RepID=A0ACC2TMV4_9FUNG|nr:hypothetical protein DSO57_1029786 [Entomophthora muscae]